MIFQLCSFGSKSNLKVLKILCHHAFKILNHFVNIVSANMSLYIQLCCYMVERNVYGPSV
jgi:hypothetical protein